MDLARILHDMPKPTLAVIPGPAAGAGAASTCGAILEVAATSRVPDSRPSSECTLALASTGILNLSPMLNVARAPFSVGTTSVTRPIVTPR